jgi:2-hydroxycyclohexanecarboxyl-CoA dehydrogenase
MSENNFAIVTGAAKGIGRAIAFSLAEAGFNLVIVDLNKDRLEELKIELEKFSIKVIDSVCDLSNRESTEDAFNKFISTGLDIEVLVNNAGIDEIKPFLETEEESWQKIISVNLTAVLRTSKLIAPIMIENRRGAIINIASDAGKVGSSNEAVYSATKGGVIAFTKTLARELAKYNIRVNCVCPGPTDTDLFRSAPDALAQSLIKAIPLRRLAEPGDIANAVAFLAGNRSSYITGQAISVSGGLTMV